jgi:uncharacterized protein (TIGR02391 family)
MPSVNDNPISLKMKNKNHSSLPDLLKALWQEGFFSDAKELSEISGGLAAKGHYFPTSSLGVALIRAVKAGSFLSRVKDSGKWKYVQKHPITSAPGQRTELFARYDFHPRIKEVAFKQFEDGYFKEAIQNALVEVIDQVKIKANHPKNNNGRELDGDDLMNHVFGCDNQNPKITFNDVQTSLDKAEQRGMMNLFKGIVGIRDRKAHLNFIQNDPLKTIEYLSLASLLMRLLDERAPRHKKHR